MRFIRILLFIYVCLVLYNADVYCQNRMILSPYRGYGDFVGKEQEEGLVIQNRLVDPMFFMTPLPATGHSLAVDVSVSPLEDRSFLKRIRKHSRFGCEIVLNSEGKNTIIGFKRISSEENVYSLPDSISVTFGTMRKTVATKQNEFCKGFRIRMIFRPDVLNIKVGEREFSFRHCNEISYDSIGFRMQGGEGLLLRTMSIETGTDPDRLMTKWSDTADLKHYLDRSSDWLEGIWAVYGSTLENNLLRMGGEYKLACVKNSGGYDLIYLSGAKVWPELWRTGMRKGILHSTSFNGLFSLEWHDAEMLPMRHGLKAQVEEFGSVIRLYFPMQNSTVTLRKVNQSQ